MEQDNSMVVRMVKDELWSIRSLPKEEALQRLITIARWLSNIRPKVVDHYLKEPIIELEAHVRGES